MQDNRQLVIPPSKAEEWLTKKMSTLDKLGVYENLVRAIPAIIVMFGVSGLPAAGIAIMSLVGAGIYAAEKHHRFQQTIRQELHGAVGEVEAKTERTLDEVKAEVADMSAKLSPKQVEQLGSIFEEYMATLDDEWLGYLQRAVCGVVADNVDASMRKAVLAHLRMLGPAHVQALHYVWNKVEQDTGKKMQIQRSHVGQSSPVFSVEVQVVLESVGFIERGERIRTDDPDWTHTNIGVTLVGAAALKLLYG
ncbi:MAG: hypothetical protein GY807_17830 [Gammaproteobacteria bacterium]|nr:hypothetical protein [Gammaproteobacteria bacterium]